MFFLVVGGNIRAEEISVPYPFSPGTTIRSSEMNENFQIVYDKMNEALKRLAILESQNPFLIDRIYFQNWEDGISGWHSKHTGDPIVLIEDLESSARTTVHKITRDDSGGNYFSSTISVIPGEGYCLSAWINWVSGGWPFLGIEEFTQDERHLRYHWLIGQEGYDSGFSDGTIVTPVQIQDGWHWFRKTFTVERDVTKIKIMSELFNSASATRGGSPLAYFDDIALYRGTCS